MHASNFRYFADVSQLHGLRYLRLQLGCGGVPWMDAADGWFREGYRGIGNSYVERVYFAVGW